MMASRKRSSMGKLAHVASRKTDKALEERELEVLLETNVDWDMLRPQVTDTATFDKLRKVVEESTSKNERIARLRKSIEGIGKEGINLAKSIVSMT